MAQQLINIGAVANDHTGDQLRTAFNKINLNFTDLYGGAGDGGTPVLINGDFALWQRATSFTADGYTADRWRWTEGSGNTATLSRQALPLDTATENPVYFLQIARSVSASDTLLEQRVENVYTGSNRSVTLSFWAKGDTGTTIQAYTTQNFGTGGSPSSPVSTTAQNVVITTSWVRYTVTFALASITGKTLGTAGNDYVSFIIVLPTAAGNRTLSVALAQVDLAATAKAFIPVPVDIALTRAQRYYEIFGSGAVGRWISATQAVTNARFATTKRGTPTVAVVTQTWEGARAGLATVSGSSYATASAATVISTNAYSALITVNNIGAASGDVCFIYTDNVAADAEL